MDLYSKKENNQAYTIQFKNQVTNRTITKRNYYSGGLIDTSSFEKGLHFVEVISNTGEIIITKFLKL